MTEQIETQETIVEPTDKELEYINQIAQLEQDKANLTGEIQDIRKKNKEKDDELESLRTPKEPKATGEVDVEEKVRSILSERDKAVIAQEKEEAFDEFKQTHKEFDPSNDPGGLKFAAFEKELKKFNLEGLTSKKQFSSRLKEVHEFMNRHKQPVEDTITPTPVVPSSGADPSKGETHVLTQIEKTIINRLGWTSEKYLKIKLKNPVYVQKLIEQYRP